MIIHHLPRQARDKQIKESSTKNVFLFSFCSQREFSLAASLAKDADATVLVMGMLVLRQNTDPKFGTSCCEGEGNDRDG